MWPKSSIRAGVWTQASQETLSSILAWEIPWTGEPGRLQSMGSQSRTQHSLTSAKSTLFPSHYTVPLPWNRRWEGKKVDFLTFPIILLPHVTPEWWWQVTVLTLPMVAHIWSQRSRARAHTDQKIKQNGQGVTTRKQASSSRTSAHFRTTW